MKRNIVNIVLTLSIFASLNVFSATIKSIDIIGLDAISRGTVLSYLPVEVGDEYLDNTSGQIISALYKTDFFKDIDVSQEDQVLKIKITENPHIKYMEVINYSNKVLEEESLNKILTSMKLTQGQIFNKKLLNSLVTKLKDLYISKGYYNIDIKKDIEIDKQNRVGISLDVNEGEVARIGSIRINGANMKNEEDLLNLFEIGEADFFIMNFFTERDHYSKIALDAGIEKMRSLYNNNGYLDFEVKDTKIEFSENKENINVSIDINEGPLYRVGEIKISGDLLDKSAEYLESLINISTGDVFRRKDAVEGVQTIANVFTDLGYALAKVEPIATENKKNHTIDLDIKIALNKKVYINRITISGNTRTQDDVIRREIDIFEGGVYSSSELDESIKKIKRLGFFSDVQMQVSEIEGVKDKINLHFKVEETKTGTFSIGLSHANSTGASFNVGIKEKNFLGTGNTLNASVSNSDAVQAAELFFVDPHFTNDGHSINYGVFYKDVSGEDLDVADYEISEVGANVGYGIPVTEDTRIGADIRFSTRDIACGTTFASADYEQEQCAKNDKTELKTTLNWSNNTLNDYNYPTDGQKNYLNLGIALPVADFRYYKLDASHRSYYPLTNDLTFKTNGKLGIAQGYGDNDLPFFKRYYGGGASSIRGIAFNSLGAKYNNGDVKGGELSLVGGVSVISPLKFINNSDNMRISAFIDTAAISDSISSFETDDLRMSTGIAFNWITPIGPLGFFTAVPIIKKSDDETKSFDFNLGTSF